MNADELNDLLENPKEEEPAPRSMRHMERIDAIMMDQNMSDRQAEYMRHFRSPNPIDQIQMINNLMASYNTSLEDLQRIYHALQNMVHNGVSFVTSVDVNYARENPTRILTVELYNGTRLVYDI